MTDFSSIVTKVPGDTDVVFLPWQQAPQAQTFAQQMAEQGKKAKIFGSDGTNAPDKFKFPGAYVSNFAPDITGIPQDKALVAGWKKANPGTTVGSFGPPTYGATQIAMMAIKAACTAGGGKVTRAAVLAQVPKVKIKQWILGGSWTASRQDPRPGRRPSSTSSRSSRTGATSSSAESPEVDSTRAARPCAGPHVVS